MGNPGSMHKGQSHPHGGSRSEFAQGDLGSLLGIYQLAQERQTHFLHGFNKVMEVESHGFKSLQSFLSVNLQKEC